MIPNFVIQGGCPQGTGTGGPGYKIKCEVTGGNQRHDRGVLSMAHAGRDTGGSQFFICHGDAKFLDRQYTAFGELVQGDDVLERIATVPTQHGGGGEKSTPIDRVELVSVTIVPAA